MLSLFASLQYRVVYDARAESFADWTFPAMGLALAGIGWLVRWGAASAEGTGRQSIPGRGGEEWSLRDVRAFATVFAGLGLFFALLSTGAMYLQHASLLRALDEGSFTVVEGVVTSFHRDGREREVWQVESDGRPIEYSLSPFVSGPGYRIKQGGPRVIGNGSAVRIADVDGVIARLEIK